MTRRTHKLVDINLYDLPAEMAKQVLRHDEDLEVLADNLLTGIDITC